MLKSGIGNDMLSRGSTPTLNPSNISIGLLLLAGLLFSACDDGGAGPTVPAPPPPEGPVETVHLVVGDTLIYTDYNGSAWTHVTTIDYRQPRAEGGYWYHFKEYLLGDSTMDLLMRMDSNGSAYVKNMTRDGSRVDTTEYLLYDATALLPLTPAGDWKIPFNGEVYHGSLFSRWDSSWTPSGIYHRVFHFNFGCEERLPDIEVHHLKPGLGILVRTQSNNRHVPEPPIRNVYLKEARLK